MASGRLPLTEQNSEENPLPVAEEKTTVDSLPASGEKSFQCPIINQVIEDEIFPSRAELHEQREQNIYVDESLEVECIPHKDVKIEKAEPIPHKDAKIEKAKPATDDVPLASHVTTKSSNSIKRNALLAAIRNVAGSQLESPSIGQHSHEENQGKSKPHPPEVQSNSCILNSEPILVKEGDVGEHMPNQVKAADFSSVENHFSNLSIETEDSKLNKTDESIMIDSISTTPSQDRSALFSPNVTPLSFNKISSLTTSTSDTEHAYLEPNTRGAFDGRRQFDTIEPRIASERKNNVPIPLMELLASASCLGSTLNGATLETCEANVFPLCSSLSDFNIESNLSSPKVMKDSAASGAANEDQPHAICLLEGDSCLSHITSGISLSEQNHIVLPTSFVSNDDNGVKISGNLSLDSKSSKHAIVPRKSIDAYASPMTAVDVVMKQHACDGSIATTKHNLDNRPDAGIYTPSISLKVVLDAVVCFTYVRPDSFLLLRTSLSFILIFVMKFYRATRKKSLRQKYSRMILNIQLNRKLQNQ
jgi:hypothetical protein